MESLRYRCAVTKSESRKVVCGKHGETPATFMCQHLTNGVGCGFHCSTAKKSPWPDAWCAACEVVLNRERRWNDAAAAFANIKLLCTHCYDAAKARNSQPSLRYLGAPAKPAALEKLFHTWVHETQERNDNCKIEFGMGAYEYDPELATITFSKAGNVQSIADVQMVGSFSTNTNTWLWGWAKAHVPRLIRDIRYLRTFGEVRGIPNWTNDQAFAADEFDAWQFTAAAATLLNAQAVYRMPQDYMRFFLVLHNLRRPE